MVVNKNGTTEQVTHYYPYGGLIGDISTLLSDVTKGTLLSDVTKGNNENVQKYKFEGPRSHQKEIDNLLARRRAFRRGVELDRTFGLDNYDIHARQYFAMAPSWDRIDKKAEDYYPISPYSYCGGDPINRGDYDGEETRVYVETNRLGHTFITTGKGTSTTVYSYGRYGGLGKDKSIARDTTPFGEGVLLVMKGDEAKEYINEEISNKEATIFELSNVDERKIESYFLQLFDSSESNPSAGKYSTCDNAKVIDQYNVFSNNCTTKAMDAIRSTGENTAQYWSNMPIILKANLELLNSIQKIEYFFSGHPIDIKIVDPKEIEEEYE